MTADTTQGPGTSGDLDEALTQVRDQLTADGVDVSASIPVANVGGRS